MSQMLHIELAIFLLTLICFFHVVAIIGYSPPLINAQIAVDNSDLHHYLPDKLPDDFDAQETRSQIKKHIEQCTLMSVVFPRYYTAADTFLTLYLIMILRHQKKQQRSIIQK